jgi:hypothetical protein
VAAFPAFRVTIVNLTAGEELVMGEAKYTMTHEGEFILSAVTM